MIIETVALFFKEGKSDKFYIVSIEQDGEYYSVPFTFGRCGTSGQSGYKVSKVSLGVARKSYDKVVKEKRGKGYKEDGDVSSVVISTIGDKVDTGIYPQLLNPIEESEVERYLLDSDYGAQEKYDGKRKFLRKSGKVTSINRKGQEVGYPALFEDVCNDLTVVSKFLIDGEEVGSVYHAFDLLEYGDDDLRSQPYAVRYAMLKDLLSDNDILRLAPIAIGYEEKRALYDRLQVEGKEGIVFKRLDAGFIAGKGHRDQIKCKFYSTASCIVVGINKKRSIALGLYDGSDLIGVGNCTIPSNKDIPVLGSSDKPTIVEIRYLYAHLGGSLYQPTYIGPRDDIDYEDCVLSQLKYKSED